MMPKNHIFTIFSATIFYVFIQFTSTENYKISLPFFQSIYGGASKVWAITIKFFLFRLSIDRLFFYLRSPTNICPTLLDALLHPNKLYYAPERQITRYLF
jgi:hypothetical protein